MKVPFRLQGMEDRIEGAGAQPVTVSSQFLGQVHSTDWLDGSVVQNMDPDEAEKKLSGQPVRTGESSLVSQSGV